MTVFKTVVCAAIALVSASGVVAAKGPSAITPGGKMQTQTPSPSDRGDTKGASRRRTRRALPYREPIRRTEATRKARATFAPGQNK